MEAVLTSVLPPLGAAAAGELAVGAAAEVESAVRAMAAVAPQGAAHWEPFLPGLVVLLPLLGFVANALLALSASRRSSAAVRAGKEWDPFAGAVRPRTHTLPTWIGPGVMAGAFVLAAVNFATALGAHLEEPVIAGPYWTWIATETLRVDAALHLDPLSLAMMLVVTGVGFLIHVFSVGYMRDDPGYPRYFAYLNLFVFFMLVLVLGSGYATMFVGWEGVGLCSYLLIGYWFSDREKSDAGKKAFIVNRIGDFGFLLAVFLIFQAFGTLDFVSVAAGAEGEFAYGGATVTAITLLLMLGAAGKSAQVPLHVWLPDAMAGPTPVSALIHAATMVTAGVYMVVRSSALYALAPASPGGGGGGRRAHGVRGGDDRPQAARHQEGAGLLHGLPAGLHVPGRGSGSVRGRGLPLGDPCLLQGASLPGRRGGDPRHAPCDGPRRRRPRRAGPPGHAEHGRTAEAHARHLGRHGGCHAGHCRDMALRRLLLEGRDHLVRGRVGRRGVERLRRTLPGVLGAGPWSRPSSPPSTWPA